MEYLTLQDKEKLIQKIEILKERVEKSREKVKIALSYGDLRENSDYNIQSQKLESYFSELNFWINLFEKSEVFDFKEGEFDPKEIRFGSRIKLENKKGEEECFELVSRVSSDFNQGKIYYLSPFAKAFYGKKEGEQVIFNNVWRLIKKVNNLES